ncbi:MAG: hypothetical protein JOZ78_13780 [Chroococcidiopsidaceae cyanobacterium CP_BM_ER_R8_30]|nr:hypothetical protein [Chroococcidiopsidaceae cyanobacterium CP_BM_ER_R8_30]
MSEDLLLDLSAEEAASIAGGATYGFSYSPSSSPFAGQFAVNGQTFGYNYVAGQQGQFAFSNPYTGKTYNVAWNGTGAPSYSAA